MGEQGKYHGQRLKERDVLRLYAAGERDFQSTTLRDCNFRSADLSGADFSGTDIRGTNFSKSILHETIFDNCKSGLLAHQIIYAALASTITLLIFGIVSYSTGHASGIFLERENIRSLSTIFAFLGIVLTSLFFPTLKNNYTETRLTLTRSIKLVQTSIISLLSGVITITLSCLLSFYNEQLSTTLFFCTFLLLLLALASARDFTTFYFLLYFSASSFLGFFLQTYRTYGIPDLFDYIALITWYFAFAFLLPLLITYSILYYSLGFTRIPFFLFDITFFGSTSFRGADLAKASFLNSDIFGTDFSRAIINNTIFSNAKRFEWARFSATALISRKALNLIVHRNGFQGQYSGIDLAGLNLQAANLSYANLSDSRLNGTNLSGANLTWANLTKAQLVGADLSRARLTGACLEAWNIDETTVLEDIDCLYVFLKETPDVHGNRERRPHNPDKDFAPGDFEKLFKEMLDTVQILIRNGINPESFKAALQHLMDHHPGITPDSIQGFERKGKDVLVTLQVREGADKGSIEQTWEKVYEARLQAAATRAQLDAEQRRADDVKEVALGFSKFLSSFQINNMNNPINAGDSSFYAGGDVNLSGSTLNLGEISGQVSNQINQLPDVAPDPGKPSLKDLLTQLQQAVETDPELSDIEKKEALGEVAKLAEAGSNPTENAMQRMVKRAADNLKSIAEPLTEASNLAEACKKLLPLILPLFALL